MVDFAEIFKNEGSYPATLLDIGCGPCPEGKQILEKGISLTGIDQDGETIRRVRKQLPKGVFITADAAVWLPQQKRKYDAVLFRRPDVIFRSANWHQIFLRLPSVLSNTGRVVVTTPGESEARLCDKWLREIADNVERSATELTEEGYMIMAENFRTSDTGIWRDEDNDTGSLIRRLAWEDDQPHMVCDLRTGKCTAVTDDEADEEAGGKTVP